MHSQHNEIAILARRDCNLNSTRKGTQFNKEEDSRERDRKEVLMKIGQVSYPTKSCLSLKLCFLSLIDGKK
jgi:hypothetical protein